MTWHPVLRAFSKLRSQKDRVGSHAGRLHQRTCGHCLEATLGKLSPTSGNGFDLQDVMVASGPMSCVVTAPKRNDICALISTPLPLPRGRNGMVYRTPQNARGSCSARCSSLPRVCASGRAGAEQAFCQAVTCLTGRALVRGTPPLLSDAGHVRMWSVL